MLTGDVSWVMSRPISGATATPISCGSTGFLHRLHLRSLVLTGTPRNCCAFAGTVGFGAGPLSTSRLDVGILPRGPLFAARIRSPPKDEPLSRLLALLFRKQNRKISRANPATVTAPAETAMPAICWFVRVDFCVAAAADVSVEEMPGREVVEDDPGLIGKKAAVLVGMRGGVPEAVSMPVIEDVEIGVSLLEETEEVKEMRFVCENQESEHEDEIEGLGSVVVRVLWVSKVIVVGFAIVAVMVLCVMGFAPGTEAQTPYAAAMSNSCSFVQSDARQRRAPSPNVKPVLLSRVHKQSRSCGSGQVEVGNEVAMKASRQL